MLQTIKSVDDILIHNKKNKLYLSLNDIAEATNNEVKSVIRMITRKESDFLSLGFDTGKLPLKPNGQRDWSTVLMNKTQTTFLLSLMQNNEIITNFKLKLAIKLEQLEDQIQLAYEQEIRQLRKIERTTNVYAIQGENYTSARGMVELNDEEFTAKEFKEEMAGLGLIEKKLVLVPKWQPLPKGVELGLVAGNKEGTAVYNINKCLDIFKQAKAIDDE